MIIANFSIILQYYNNTWFVSRDHGSRSDAALFFCFYYVKDTSKIIYIQEAYLALSCSSKWQERNDEPG